MQTEPGFSYGAGSSFSSHQPEQPLKPCSSQMKPLVFLSVVSIASAASFALSAKSWSQDNPNLSDYMICGQITSHKALYQHGKFLASGWMYWLKSNKKDEERFPVKTRESFLTRATIGLNKKNGITEKKNPDLYMCNMGFMSTAIDSRWSSIHDGLVDYFPKPFKAKFLELPER